VMGRDQEPFPVAPITVTISMRGDNWDYIVRHLHELAVEAEQSTPDLFRMVSGGGWRCGVTNCSHCSAEIEDDQVCKCEICEEDGLCPDCSPHEFHTQATRAAAQEDDK
jgi:hypothetical protein